MPRGGVNSRMPSPVRGRDLPWRQRSRWARLS